MPVTWSPADIITRARRLLQDTVQPYRFDDGVLIDYYNDGLVQAIKLRPDILYDGTTDFSYGASVAPTTTATDTTTLATESLPVHERYIEPLAFYIAGMAELSDDEFVQDGRAVVLITKFEQKLQQV